MTFRHETLKNYYETNFALMQHHKYSLTELDGLIPWEKSIYINKLLQYLEEERERIKQEQLLRKR
jgi:hypothetical protein